MSAGDTVQTIRRTAVLTILISAGLASGHWGQRDRATARGLIAPTFAVAAPIAGGPLSVHPANPRYFTDASGRAVYLTGSHFWTTIQSWDPAKGSAPSANGNSAFDTFAEYVAFLRDRNHNFTRLWTFDHFLYESTPSPWMRTGPGVAFDGLPKWDVSRVNNAYLDRLRSRVRQFRDYGIYVSVMFFRGNYARGAHPAWDAHPFNPANNVNEGLAGLTYDAYNGLNHAPSLALQKQHVRAVIDTLNDMDNVIWEIANEAQPGSYPWQEHLADYVRSYESRKPSQHLVGITSTYPNDNAALRATNADWISLGQTGYDPNNPPATTGEKIIVSDTDHHLLERVTVPWVWKAFLRGEHPILMENELGWNLEPVRRAMGHARALAQRINLAAMTPQNALAETGYSLVDPGVEHVVYAPGGGTFWVDLSKGSGKTFAVVWINPRTGAETPAPGVLGGNMRHDFSAPLNDSGAVLHLKRT
jgi:hypothetical protein